MKLNICESIRELRRAHGTTQEALAQALLKMGHAL